MALVVVLSVMRGFEDDLKGKILGTNAHLVILQHGAPSGLPGYRSKAQGVEGVVAATPSSLPKP